MSDLLVVEDGTFEEQILKSPQPALVDFWAPWCGPCRMVAPVVEELAREYDGKVRFAKLDVDQNSSTPSRFGVRGVPTLIIFKGGREVDRVVGFRPKGDIKKRLDAALV